jgi:hypothetical protein
MSSAFNWRGTYDLSATYVVGDVVYFPDDEFTYICIENTFGIPPYLPFSGFEKVSGVDISNLDGGVF